MTSQSLEASVAVIQEQLKTITEDMREARGARKAQYEQNERQNATLVKIDHRLEKVEQWMTSSDPTIQDVRRMKLQAEGAGKLGRILWVLAGASIGAAATLAAYWNRWISGN